MIKRLFKKAQDEGEHMEMVLLEFGNTPITGLDESPAHGQLLMSRHLRSHMPTMFQPTLCQGKACTTSTEAEMSI